MCGRYAIECEEENIVLKEIMEEINRKYAGDPLLSHMKTGEIFPTETAPVLALENNQTRPFLMNWGFPRQGRAAPAGSLLINARAETAMEKSMFRLPFASGRCIVPSTGFYEWKQEEEVPDMQTSFLEPGANAQENPSASRTRKKKKDKYLLRLPDDPMLYMAGFYNNFRDGSAVLAPAFVIITTAANESVSPMHNRMPLILDEESAEKWLHDGQAAIEILLCPCEARLSAKKQSE